MTRLAVLPPDLLSIPQAAARLGVSATTALRLANCGELPGAFRVGRRWRVSALKLERFIHGDAAQFSPSHPLTPREDTTDTDPSAGESERGGGGSPSSALTPAPTQSDARRAS